MLALTRGRSPRIGAGEISELDKASAALYDAKSEIARRSRGILASRHKWKQRARCASSAAILVVRVVQARAGRFHVRARVGAEAPFAELRERDTHLSNR